MAPEATGSYSGPAEKKKNGPRRWHRETKSGVLRSFRSFGNARSAGDGGRADQMGLLPVAPLHPTAPNRSEHSRKEPHPVLRALASDSHRRTMKTFPDIDRLKATRDRQPSAAIAAICSFQCRSEDRPRRGRLQKGIALSSAWSDGKGSPPCSLPASIRSHRA